MATYSFNIPNSESSDWRVLSNKRKEEEELAEQKRKLEEQKSWELLGTSINIAPEPPNVVSSEYVVGGAPGKQYMAVGKAPNEEKVNDIAPESVQTRTLQSGSGQGIGASPIGEAYKAIKTLPNRLNEENQRYTQQMNETNKKLADVWTERANTEAAAQQAQADIMRSGMQAYELVQRDNQKKMEAANASVNEKMNQYTQAVNNLANTKIQPSRLFQTTGSKVGAAIAIMLGGIGAGLSGGRNQGYAAIQDAINRDVQTQFAEIDKLRGVVTARQAEAGMARQIFSDIESQKLAAENAIMNKVKMQANVMAMESKRDDVKYKAQELIAGLDADMARNTNALAQKQKEFELRALSTQATVASRLPTVGTGLRKPPPPGLAYVSDQYVPDKKDEIAAKQFTSVFNESRGALDALIKWRKKHGAETLDRKALREGKALTARAIIELKKGDEMGANFTDMERELVGLSDDPGEIGFYLTKLETIRESLNTKAMGHLRPYGFNLADTAYKGKGQKISQ
jgi:hypothetical protein